MPRGDGTGPEGTGPMTGRAAGTKCKRQASEKSKFCSSHKTTKKASAKKPAKKAATKK